MFKYTPQEGSISVVLSMITATIVALAVAASLLISRQVSKEAQHLRSLIFANGVIEQLGAATDQARKVFLTFGSTCDASTTYYPSADPTDGFCFPSRICVLDPNDNSIELCSDDGATGSVDLFQIANVKQGLEANYKPIKKPNSKVVTALKNIKKSIADFHEKLFYADNTSYAQEAYNLDNFTGATPTPATLDSTCTGTLCKDCSDAANPPGGNLITCIRFKVCPTYSACDPLNNLEWIVVKVGALNSPPDPAP